MPNLHESLKKRMSCEPNLNLLPTPFLKKKKLWSTGIMIFSVCCLFGSTILLQKKLSKFAQKQKDLDKSVKLLEQGLTASHCFGKTSVPLRLANVPLGEETGLVINVKSLPIRNVLAPYNPSLIESASGYDMVFRYDITNPKPKHSPYSSNIGVVHCTKQFEQGAQEFKRIDLQTESAEDPRIVSVGDQVYLVFNQFGQETHKCRFISVANLDKSSYEVKYITVLDMNLKWFEKNWSPFEYIDEAQKAHLFLEYQISPRKLLELPDPQVNQLTNLTLPSNVAYLSFPWSKKWGEIRGGTPPKKVGDEYLGFFHSFFIDERDLAWYVMGAYTFEAHYPFCLTGISKNPILFQGIYETPFTNTASIAKRVIYPSGFVIEKEGDKDLIHLACGENDSGIKIVTIDKEKLLESMNRFEK